MDSRKYWRNLKIGELYRWGDEVVNVIEVAKRVHTERGGFFGYPDSYRKVTMMTRNGIVTEDFINDVSEGDLPLVPFTP